MSIEDYSINELEEEIKRKKSLAFPQPLSDKKIIEQFDRVKSLLHGELTELNRTNSVPKIFDEGVVVLLELFYGPDIIAWLDQQRDNWRQYNLYTGIKWLK